MKVPSMLTTRHILPPSLCRRGPFLMQDMGNHNRRTRSLQLCCILRRKMPVILHPPFPRICYDERKNDEMLNLNIELSNEVDCEVRCFLLWGKFGQTFWGSLQKLLTLLIPHSIQQPLWTWYSTVPGT